MTFFFVAETDVELLVPYVVLLVGRPFHWMICCPADRDVKRSLILNTFFWALPAGVNAGNTFFVVALQCRPSLGRKLNHLGSWITSAMLLNLYLHFGHQVSLVHSEVNVVLLGIQ